MCPTANRGGDASLSIVLRWRLLELDCELQINGAVRHADTVTVMIAAWLRDLLNKASKNKPGHEPEWRDLPLADFWLNQMLQSASDCIYEVSRTEPFRLRHVRASDTPVTPALINRTVATVVGIIEPEQPTLGREFCRALRSVKPDTPVQLRYSTTHYGVIRVATFLDLGPEHDRLYVHCREESAGGPLP